MTVEALNTRGLDYPVGTSYALGPVDASEIDEEKLSKDKRRRVALYVVTKLL